MRIDVFHDTTCPWCRIGKAHLKRALEQWDGEPVEVHYHAFMLNPDIPAEGYDFRSYMHAKGGGQVPLEGWFDGPRRAGAAAGLVFNFETITKAPNTVLSHQLVALTPDDRKEAIFDALNDAYFQHGQDIGDLEVLGQLAASVGLDAQAMKDRLAAGEGREQVLAEVREAHRLGVNGVPFFVFNNLYAFSGAQPPDVILQVMRQTAEFQEAK